MTDPAHQDRIIRYYAERAATYDTERSRNWTADSPFRRRVTDFCLRTIEPVPPGSVVLDVGAGTGRTAAEVFHARDIRYFAVDLSPAMLSVLHDRTGGAVPAVVGDAHSLPFATGSVAAAFLVSVLQYLELQRAAESIARVLAPQGRLMLGTICLHPDDRDRWRDAAFQRQDPPYLARFRHAVEVVDVFTAAGLALTEHSVIKYRRSFRDLRMDRSHNVEAVTLPTGLRTFAVAPAEARRLYDIDATGFTQHYNLFLFQDGRGARRHRP